MDSQNAGPDSGGSATVNAAEILLLAGSAATADVTPPWGRERALELIDAPLALATQYGFAQADALRGMLVDGIFTDRTRLLADVAFSVVPQGAVLEVVRATGCYTAGLSDPNKGEPQG